jgi:hypothetical protein
MTEESQPAAMHDPASRHSGGRPPADQRAASPHTSIRLVRFIIGVCGVMVSLTPPARAQVGFGGTATYTGNLGPVSRARTICVCVSTDANLSNSLGCLEIATNGGRYFAQTNTNTYYLVGFLDLNANIGLDAGEPYEIYQGKSAPPADPVVAGLGQTAIDFSFGDENIWPPPTPTPTDTPADTPTQTPWPIDTETPTPSCPGDCDGNGQVTVGELVTLVNIALGSTPPSACMAGDTDSSNDITVDEIIAAVNGALAGCPT